MPRWSEGALVAAVLCAASPAQAAERHQVSIAPGRLGDAVIALGRQTGISIGMSDQGLAGLPVRKPVTGRMSVDRALDRMLSGTGARALRIDAQNWRIVRARLVRRPLAAAPIQVTPVEAQGEDIVVTASKRDVPLTLYAGTVEIVNGGSFSAAEAASGTAALLNRVASLSSTHVGAGRNKLFIRAIADSGFAGPTQATTGQYLGDMRLNYAAPDPDLRLYDVSGVEVLEGPQGTLYGAGSLGGIVRVVPNAPNLGAFGARVGAGVSATQHGDMGGDLSATMNLPIVPERLALRMVAYGSSEGGYIDNPKMGRDDINGTAIAGGRAALRFAPDAEWTVDLNGLYQRIDSDDAQYATRSVGRLDQQSPVPQNSLSDYWLVNARVERRWGDMSFVSTTGFVRHFLSERYDATPALGVPGLFHQRNRTELFSTENRLSRDLHDGLGWILGFSYIDSESTIRRTLGAVDLPLPSTGVRNSLNEWTLFGEASVQPIDALVVTVGGRVTTSRLGGEALDPVQTYPTAELVMAEAQANRRETIFLPSFSLLSDALPGVTLFVRYQQGFRPGGLAVDDYRVQRFRNDRISTLETGLRRGIPGRDPVALSASFAYTDWKNIQADLTDRQSLPSTANIGDGRIYTIEGRVVLRPARALTLDGSVIYNDSRLSQPAPFVRLLSFAGTTLALPNVASWGGRVAADYRVRMDDGAILSLSGSARYVGRSRLGVGPVFGREQGDYVDTSLTAAWSRGQLQLSASLTNLFDAAGNRFALGTPFNLHGDDYTPMRPRTLRLGVDFAF